MQIADAFARIDGGEIWLHQLTSRRTMYSPDATPATTPTRKRKLLLHRHEIERLRARVDPEHLSLIPLSIYFKDGRAKVELGPGQGPQAPTTSARPSPSGTPPGTSPRANRGDKGD